MPRVTRPEPGSTRAVAPRYPRSVSDRPSRWRLLRRRYRGTLRVLAMGVVGLSFVAVLALLMKPVPLHAPARAGLAHGAPVAAWRARLGALLPLHVQQIVVLGRANTPEPTLRAAIGVLPGQPILAVSVADIRARIEALPWVEHATVERHLPGTVLVQVQERRPFAIWQNQGKFLLIDRQGQVVTDEAVAAFRELPLVVGPGAPEHAAALLDAIAALPALQARMTAAVRVGERRWNLVLNNDIQVLLPEGAAPAALARLMQLQTGHDLLDRPLQVVDMRLPDRLMLRPRPASPAPGTAAPADLIPVAPGSRAMMPGPLAPNEAAALRKPT